ncbi:hypothetical protein AAG906_023962 [Vitis piasezkii]
MDSQALLSKQDDTKLHVVMFPWLAFGHMIPYLELAKLIAQRGHRVSFVSTPRNIDRLPKLPSNVAPFISFVKLPVPHVPNLPENAESTTDVPYNKVQFLKIANDLLQEPMARFLDASAPDWVLHDFAPYWLGPIAAKLGISCSFFSIFNAPTLGFLASGGREDRTDDEHFTVSPKWVPFPSRVAFRFFEIKKIFESVEGDGSGVSDLYRLSAGIRGCDLLAVRSCFELEHEWLRLLEQLHRQSVIPVGSRGGVHDLGASTQDTDSRLHRWLLESFRWSSVVEALHLARPLILLTFLADQGLNASILQEKKMGYLIPRNDRDGSFTRDSVAHSLSLVVLEEEGKIYRDKAKEMKGVFGDRVRQNEYVDNFLSCLQAHRQIHKAKTPTQANGIHTVERSRDPMADDDSSKPR